MFRIADYAPSVYKDTSWASRALMVTVRASISSSYFFLSGARIRILIPSKVAPTIRKISFRKYGQCHNRNYTVNWMPLTLDWWYFTGSLTVYWCSLTVYFAQKVEFPTHWISWILDWKLGNIFKYSENVNAREANTKLWGVTLGVWRQCGSLSLECSITVGVWRLRGGLV